MATISGMRIGFIGLGLMGAPMAQNLLAAGAALAVHNRTPDKMRPLGAKGALVCADFDAVAAHCAGGIVIICVADTEALQNVLRGGAGQPGLLSRLAPGTLVIDMGTSAVATTRALAAEAEARDLAYVDAPVSGGEVGALEKTLSVMAGGEQAAVTRAEPVFRVLGSRITHLGGPGCGQAAKAANQLVVGQTLIAVAEALVLAEAAGADMSKTRAALLGGFAASRILELHGQRMIDRSFTPGGKAATQLKDLQQAAALGREQGLDLPGLDTAVAVWREMVAHGMGELDQAGIFQLISETAKTSR
jgi:3-hydroxyisobutyrate dehydrogenase-like beta-hydroxyacid dehydrogenase